MKVSAFERRYLRRALRRAIENDDSLIDAYRVQWSKKERGAKVIPESARQLVRKLRKNIAAFRKMLAALDGDSQR